MAITIRQEVAWGCVGLRRCGGGPGRGAHRHHDDPCAVVSVIGGYDLQETAEDYAAMVRAATRLHAIGVSVWDWPTTPPSAWPPLQGYDVAGC